VFRGLGSGNFGGNGDIGQWSVRLDAGVFFNRNGKRSAAGEEVSIPSDRGGNSSGPLVLSVYPETPVLVKQRA